jgi:hypothetical protein
MKIVRMADIERAESSALSSGAITAPGFPFSSSPATPSCQVCGKENPDYKRANG